MGRCVGISFRDPATSNNPALLFWSRDEEEVGEGIRAKRKFRSQKWFDNPNHPAMIALYVECYQS